MRDFFTSRFFTVIAVVLLFCLGAAVYTGAEGGNTPVTSTTGILLTPLQKAVTVVVDKIADTYNYFFQYDKMRQENQELKRRLAEIEQENRDAQVALEENKRLRALMGIKERNRSFDFEMAEVIARSPGAWSTTISIDKGSLAGIGVDNCVITEDGMVGYVSSVTLNSAEITTIIDTDMQAGALITRTREVSVAEGDFALMGEGMLKLSYLKKDADIVIGDTVETSGSGGLFPKGLMIGTVERIIPEEHGISNYAVIRPFVDVSSVKNVFIIKSFDITE